MPTHPESERPRTEDREQKRRHRTVLCPLSSVLCVLAPALAAAACDWPAYRGPTADGHAAADARPPLQWGETQNVRWKTAIHDKGWSSPVICGNQIWMTTARPDGKVMFAVCVDRDTGRVVHDIKLFDVARPPTAAEGKFNEFNSFASPTPAVEEGRVYLHFGTFGTACLDTATGKKLWERRDQPCDHHRGPASSPILHGDLLILLFDGFDVQYVEALDKRTGRTVWHADRRTEYPIDDGDRKKGYATARVITVNGREELVCPAAQATTAYDPATGRELWRVVHGGMNAALRPVYAHGLVFLTTGSGGKQLVAVRPGGNGDVTADHTAWSYAKQVPTRSSPIVVDDLLYFVSDKGVLTAVEAKTGQEIKTLRLGGEYTASPVFAGGHLYFFDQAGRGTVVKPGRDFSVVAINRLDDGCMASPAAAGGALFVRTRTHLYRIE